MELDPPPVVMPHRAIELLRRKFPPVAVRDAPALDVAAYRAAHFSLRNRTSTIPPRALFDKLPKGRSHSRVHIRSMPLWSASCMS